MIILGLDIGGANTKAALLRFKEKKIFESFSYLEYFHSGKILLQKSLNCCEG